MARIRTIKPEFWTSEQVMECSTTSRLLFIGMWNFCDDAGNHPAAYRTLKAEVFPADDFTALQVEALVSELMAAGLIEEYEADGKKYWHVTGWHHQRIEKPNFKHPTHENRLPVEERSPTSRRPVEERSTPEGKCNGIGEGWAIEVKRTETYCASFWDQAVMQAASVGRRPVLFWRKSRAKWAVFVDAYDIAPSVFNLGKDPVQMTLPMWCQLARALMPIGGE